ncbi:hypothetical protein HYH02_011607 [Chlamydomonas schloesseri]|uniref:Bacterial surface antigen (D15) domain-containing protein n=1 Tax=Chlamydomonas schloesseri TaxID=2026947 RepID=A0A835T2E2_9CHLO|nr:hypothetical protein HYH02_011607 [Chlamydomonas schloesseri]|eukprot:KAG2436096.1 hypothetical protein HYH02_011607 [Chlamydomonas schloesseri]
MTSSEAEPVPAAAAAAASMPSADASGSAAGAPGAAATPAGGGAPGAVDYEALYEQIKDKPCHVVQINQRKDGFNGGTFRTRASLIERELEPIYQAQTLAEVHTEMEAAGKRLRQLGVFTGVSMLAHEEPLDDPTACTVELAVEESNWFKLRAATYVQGGESTFELGAGLTNAAGGAEALTANVEYGMENSHTATLAFKQPRVGGLPATLEVKGSQLFRNNQKSSSYTEQLRGAVLALRSMDGSQGLEYELGWRRLLDPSRSASRAVMAQMGDYLLSSLRYTATLDRREPGAGGAAATLGGAGWAVRSTTELAGLLPPSGAGAAGAGGAGGGVGIGGGGGAGGGGSPSSELRYVRQQVDVVANVPMEDTGAVVFSVGASAGLLLPWGPEGALTRPSCIADRFFLGGPSSLRGFKYKGVGPTDVRRPPEARAGASSDSASAAPRRDALGGDAYTSIFASLMFQLPHPALKLLRLHGHAFVNGGNVIQLAGTGRSPSELLSEWGGSWRWSCGAGLVLPTPFGRFEANYCVLLSAQEHDRVKRGLQLGFAASSVA